MERVFITRVAAAVALLGAVAVVPAHAANWDALNASGWGAGGDDAEGMASSTADPATSGHFGADIASAFQSLGMSAARAECYGRVLASQIPAGEQQQAVDLVRTASNADQVRQNVLNSGPNIVGGFTAANESCPEGMGG